MRLKNLNFITEKESFNEYQSISNNSIENLKTQIISYFRGSIYEIEYPVNLEMLSSVDVKVLEIVKKIPFGKTVSYKWISEIVNINPRRVGMALRRNPVPIIIPCHRVIKSDGNLGGYSLGVKIKKMLIEHESSILYRLLSRKI